MAARLVPDEPWTIIEPLRPAPTPRPNGGRPPLDDRAAPTGILVVPKSGIPWEMLPLEMGCGCGMICWRRLRDRLSHLHRKRCRRAELCSAERPAACV